MAKNNFELRLDTLKPTGSITRPADLAITKVNGIVNISKGDATHMAVWFDKSSTANFDEKTAVWSLADTSVTTNFSESGVYYGHLVLKDSVANCSDEYITESIMFDKDVPAVTALEISDLDGSTAITNARTINYTLSFEDNLSGVVSARIYGTYIEEKTLSGLSGNGTETGTLTILESAPQGLITVYAEVTDAAGNTSVQTA